MATSNVINRWKISDRSRVSFGRFGPERDQTYACWGGYPTPAGKILTTDWFACKVQRWEPDGRWIETFRSSMRTDGHCIKCKNSSASAKHLYQRVNLEQGSYTVQFLAFTDGSDLSQYEDVVPYAEEADQEEPTGNNAISSPVYQESVLTYVNVPPGNRLYYFVTGAFEVQEGQVGDWFVGVKIKPNKTAYVASLACTKQ